MGEVREQIRIAEELRRRMWSRELPPAAVPDLRACVAARPSVAVRDAAAHEGLWVSLVEEELDMEVGKVDGSGEEAAESMRIPPGFWESVSGVVEAVPEGHVAELEVLSAGASLSTQGQD